MQYKAFISYSHSDDLDLVAALQHGLQQFAKVWYQLRAIHVFRDKTHIVPGQGLTSTIKAALDDSEYLVLLASPWSAGSEWVQAEVDYWNGHRGPQKILLVLTEGQIVWSSKLNDFDWDRTNALPKSLGGVFKEEPVFVDLRWARTGQLLSLAYPRFREAIVDLASALRGIPKDVLGGEDVLQLKRARRFRRAAITAVATLTAAAATASIFVYLQRNQALFYRGVATTNQQIAQKNALDAAKSNDLATAQTRVAQSLDLVRKAGNASSYAKTVEMNIQAVESAQTEPAVKALRATLIEWFDELLKVDKRSRSLRSVMVVDPSGRRIALASPYRSSLAVDLKDQSQLDLCGPESIDGLWFSPDAKYLLTRRGETLQVWDVEARRQVSEIRVGQDLPEDEEGVKVWFTRDSRAFITRSVSRTLRMWALPSGRQIADLPGTEEDDTIVFSPSTPTFLTYSATRTTGTSASMWTLRGRLLWKPDPIGFYWATFYGKGSSLLASRDVYDSAAAPDHLEVYSWTVGTDGVPRNLVSSPALKYDLTQLAGEPGDTIFGVLSLPTNDCRKDSSVVTTDSIICLSSPQPQLYDTKGRPIGPLQDWPFATPSAKARASSDGTMVVFANESVAVWEAASKRFLWQKPDVKGPAVFSDDNQRVLALNNGAPSVFEARSGERISAATGSDACDLKALDYEMSILWTDREGNRLIARGPHDLCIWDAARGKLLRRLNLFSPDWQGLDQNRKSLSIYPPTQLVAAAKQFLQGCPSAIPLATR